MTECNDKNRRRRESMFAFRKLESKRSRVVETADMKTTLGGAIMVLMFMSLFGLMVFGMNACDDRDQKNEFVQQCMDEVGRATMSSPEHFRLTCETEADLMRQGSDQ